MASDTDNVIVITADDVPFQLYFIMFNVPFTLSHRMGFELVIHNRILSKRQVGKYTIILQLQRSDLA